MAIGNLFGVFEGPEVLIILAVVLLMFGGSKLPQLARSLGQAKAEFHRGQAESEAQPDTDNAVADTRETDTVTIPRSELERLRKAAGSPPTESN